jgi:hypothetical protein
VLVSHSHSHRQWRDDSWRNATNDEDGEDETRDECQRQMVAGNGVDGGEGQQTRTARIAVDCGAKAGLTWMQSGLD